MIERDVSVEEIEQHLTKKGIDKTDYRIIEPIERNIMITLKIPKNEINKKLRIEIEDMLFTEYKESHGIWVNFKQSSS